MTEWEELIASFIILEGTYAELEFNSVSWLYHRHFIREPALNPQKGLNVVLSALYLDQSCLSFCFVIRFRCTDVRNFMSATVSR